MLSAALLFISLVSFNGGHVEGVVVAAAETDGESPGKAVNKSGLKETGVEEISNAREGAVRAGPAAGAVIKKFEESGIKVRDRVEILGKMVGASYCVEAAASAVRFSICEYGNAGDAEKSRVKRLTIFGDSFDEYKNGATLLSVARQDEEKGRAAAKELVKIFSDMGKPANKEPAKGTGNEPTPKK